MDTKGKSDLNYIRFSKLLFWIAHSWATHIDIDEYDWLLKQIYERITWKAVIGNGTSTHHLPQIKITFPDEENTFV